MKFLTSLNFTEMFDFAELQKLYIVAEGTSSDPFGDYSPVYEDVGKLLIFELTPVDERGEL